MNKREYKAQIAQSPNKAQNTEHKAQSTMSKGRSTSKYRELEERTFLFAKGCRDHVKGLPRTVSNLEYGKQLIRSSGSQAANYIEANEALSKKDFKHRIKICRKETKESSLWLRLIEPKDSEEVRREELSREAESLRKIFSAILEKTQSTGTRAQIKHKT